MQPARGAFAASLVVHLAVFTVLIALPARILHRPARPDRVDVVFYRPRPVEIPPPVLPTPVARPQPKREPAPPPVAVQPPKPVPVPQREAPPVREQHAPRPQPVPPAPPVAPARQPEPVRPKVRTDVFRDVQPEPAAATPRRTTRTGTFAQVETTAPTPTTEVRTISRVGSFEVPAASPPTTAEPSRQRGVTSAGFADSSPAAVAQDPAPREHSTVKATGFNAAAPTEAAASQAAPGGSVKQGRFGDTIIVAEAPPSRAKAAAKPDTPVEILSKPRPNYTDEARRLAIEGEVVLEVIFVSTGELRVLGVVRSLGHGLDQAAIEAARSIEFKPARRNGLPVDHTATLHIVFQLA